MKGSAYNTSQSSTNKTDSLKFFFSKKQIILPSNLASNLAYRVFKMWLEYIFFLEMVLLSHLLL